MNNILIKVGKPSDSQCTIVLKILFLSHLLRNIMSIISHMISYTLLIISQPILFAWKSYQVKQQRQANYATSSPPNIYFAGKNVENN